MMFSCIPGEKMEYVFFLSANRSPGLARNSRNKTEVSVSFFLLQRDCENRGVEKAIILLTEMT